MDVSGHGSVNAFMEGLQHTFVISPWLLIVPVLTGVMISRRWPSMVVLFLAILLAVVVALLVQSDLVAAISSKSTGLPYVDMYEGMMRICYGSTDIETGNAVLNELVHTSGMSGMMPTIWLIICAQTFGGALTATGQLQDLMRLVLRFAKGAASLVASTVGTAIFCNIATADQYLSIMLSSSMFKDTFQKLGYEPRLLSRSCEDGATVTSVLVPWNTCGLTQSTVLGVATLTYLLLVACRVELRKSIRLSPRFTKTGYGMDTRRATKVDARALLAQTEQYRTGDSFLSATRSA